MNRLRKYISSALVICLCLVTLWVDRGHNHSILQCRNTAECTDTTSWCTIQEETDHHEVEGSEFVSGHGDSGICPSCMLLLKTSGAHVLILYYEYTDLARRPDASPPDQVIPDNYHVDAVLKRGPPFSLS